MKASRLSPKREKFYHDSILQNQFFCKKTTLFMKVNLINRLLKRENEVDLGNKRSKIENLVKDR